MLVIRVLGLLSNFFFFSSIHLEKLRWLPAAVFLPPSSPSSLTEAAGCSLLLRVWWWRGAGGGGVEDEERQEGTVIPSITADSKEISMDDLSKAAGEEGDTPTGTPLLLASSWVTGSRGRY